MSGRDAAASDDPESASDVGNLTPGTITRISEQRRKRGHVWVEIDGRGVSLAAEAVTRAGLAVGDLLDAAALASLLAANQVASATQTALAFLAYRPRSEREVRDRLRRGAFSEDTIDRVVARLFEWRYLDDADFARRWVESRTAARPRGRQVLKQELWQKGISRDIAGEAIAAAEIDEDAAAEALARSRLPTYAGEEPAVIRRRLGAFLARRGYGYDVVRRALDLAMGPPQDETGSPEE